MTETKNSFWSTIPGILTAVGAILGAIATLVTSLYSAGLIGSKANPTSPTPNAAASNIAEILDNTRYVATVGSTAISFPVPAGFTEPSSLAPNLRRLGEQFTPPSNRLVAMFVDEDDANRAALGNGVGMDRYFLLETLRQTEGRSIGQSDFDEVRRAIREEFDTAIQKLTPDIRRFLDGASKSMENEFNVSNLSLSIGQFVPLGIFDEKSNSISLRMLAKFSAEANGSHNEGIVVLAQTTAVIQGKLVYFYAFSTYHNKDDTEWVRAKTLTWLASFPPKR